MEQVVVILFLIFFMFEFVVEFVLNELNIRYVRRKGEEAKLPDLFAGKISWEDYRKSIEYTLAKA